MLKKSKGTVGQQLISQSWCFRFVIVKSNTTRSHPTVLPSHEGLAAAEAFVTFWYKSFYFLFLSVRFFLLSATLIEIIPPHVLSLNLLPQDIASLFWKQMIIARRRTSLVWHSQCMFCICKTVVHSHNTAFSNWNFYSKYIVVI